MKIDFNIHRDSNERLMSEETGKLVYAELAQLMDETSKTKLTIKVEKENS